MRILVVEDDRLLNNTLCYNLSAAGYEVDAALTKSVAEWFCRKQEYDMIVLDINLPDGNGFDFCRDIKESHPDTAVIFLTANDMESDMLKGYELGADDYVTKPFPMSVFQKKVSALLARIRKQSGGDFYNDGNLFINFIEMTATLNGEGLYYAVITLILVLSAGNLIAYGIFKLFQQQVSFAVFTYPLIPAASIILVILIICFITPERMYRSLSKETITERLRETE